MELTNVDKIKIASHDFLIKHMELETINYSNPISGVLSVTFNKGKNSDVHFCVTIPTGDSYTYLELIEIFEDAMKQKIKSIEDFKIEADSFRNGN